jgi:hypothetical protein
MGVTLSATIDVISSAQQKKIVEEETSKVVMAGTFTHHHLQLIQIGVQIIIFLSIYQSTKFWCDNECNCPQ